MDEQTKIIFFSVMMFIEFAVWGAWSPVLAARLLGPLKFNGKQTGWIYATIPLACLVAPMIGGQITDRWVNIEYFMGVAHLIGAVLLWLAAKEEKFGRLFVIMLLYSFCFAPTVALVNSITFRHIDEGLAVAKIFPWIPVGWVVAGLVLTGMRSLRKTESDGSDCIKLAAALSVIMGIFCFFLPTTAPKIQEGGGDLSLLLDLAVRPDMLVCLVISFFVASQLQMYFLGTAQFLQEIGVPSKWVPATMSIAQISQALVMAFLFGWLLGLSVQLTLIIGATCWLILYVSYSMQKPVWFVVSSQALHGAAYALFLIGGQVYISMQADPSISSSAQALMVAVQSGLGLFVGSLFAGFVMDRFSSEGKFNWRAIFLVPCGVMTVSIIGLILFFHPVEPEKKPAPEENAKIEAFQPKLEATCQATADWLPMRKDS